MAKHAVRRSFLPILVIAGLGAGAAMAPAAGSASAASHQYGISVFVTDTCPRPDAEWQSMANNEMHGVKSLGANSVALAFPFYTKSVTANAVFTANECPNPNPARISPSPARLAVLVKAAHALKLRVVLRPLLDEAGLARWRGAITPSNPKAWFASYQHVLGPYLRMAKTNKVEQFGIAGELNSLQKNKNWPAFIKFARKLYKGQLLMAPTWPGGPMKHAAGTTLGTDAYPRFPSQKPSATVKQILTGWNRSLKGYALPPGITIYEVGINATDDAYAFPSVNHSGAFNQNIQVTWFTAACQFVKSHKLGGVYYWGQWFEANGGNLLSQPNPNAAAQLQPKAQTAIRACFKH
jgi:hypothetical protein